jgi:Fuc2NAc and GlcNAc transferase
MNVATVITLLLTPLLSVVFTGLAVWYARFSGLIDIPGRRSSHVIATPSGGGAGIMFTLLIVSMILYELETVSSLWVICILLPAVMLAIMGAVDDRQPVSTWVRFLVQVTAAVFFMRCVTFDHLQIGMQFTGLWIAASLLFIVWMTNLYNFMDGSNGMAGAQGVFAGVVIAGFMFNGGETMLALAALLVAGACLGFLPWNLGNARIFMGDTGSHSLGFIFSALIVCGVAKGVFSLPVALLIMMVFQVDTTLTLLARVFRGERWYNAHKQHVYQQLIVHGWSHGRVLLVYQSINLFLVAPALAIAAGIPAFAGSVFLVAALVFGVAWYYSVRRLGVLA